MKTQILLAFYFLLFSCSPKAPENAAPNTKEKISLALNWYAETEHGGYLAAKAEKIYEANELNVTVIPGGPDVPVIQRVASGDVDFGIANADEVLLARAQKVPVVALMAPIQHTPLCIMVHEDSDITSLKDLKDIKLAITPTSPQALYLGKTLSLAGVMIVPYGGSVAPFLADSKSAQQGYIFSEPFVAHEKGGQVRCLMISEIGYDPYTSLLISNEMTLKERPELVKKMVRATITGWRRYLASSESADKLILELNPQMNDKILKYGFDVLKPMVLDEVAQKNGIGTMTLERWQTLLSQLVQLGLIPPNAIKAEEAFSVNSRFLGRKD